MVKYALMRDNELVKVFNNEYDVMEWIHKHHPYSFYHAVKYEGYSVKEVEDVE
jgi:hypothetical protein